MNLLYIVYLLLKLTLILFDFFFDKMILSDLFKNIQQIFVTSNISNNNSKLRGNSCYNKFVIDDVFSREEWGPYGSIFYNYNWEWVGITWCQNWHPNQIKLVVKKIKKWERIVAIVNLFLVIPLQIVSELLDNLAKS
jgi:hypothetical protein